jgi:hypothetical protein
MNTLIKAFTPRARPLPPTVIVLPMLDYDQQYPVPDWHLEHGGTREQWFDHWFTAQEDREREWREIVDRFLTQPDEFAYAWVYLDNHPVFWQFAEEGKLSPLERLHEQYLCDTDGIARCVRIHVWRGRGRRRKDTVTQVRLEAGKWPWPCEPTQEEPYEVRHEDPLLSVREPTVEVAFTALAARVHELYGDDRRKCGDPIYVYPSDSQ